MIVFPAIDIKNGRCVRLRQGEASDVTVYGEDPVETALSFEEAGAEFLHVVDLDGAFEGKGVNTPLIRSICEAVSIPVETGGGIRTMDDIEERIDAGVFRVIIGSRAAEDPSFAAKAAARWKDRIAVSIDARGDEAAVHGWTKSGGVKVMPLAKELLSSGVSTIIYTDISKDGM
uniref:HisA/HisF-related TIM barrel protein n=2 Tax=Veillonellaceae TaxID=31977 RepID=UPI004029700D